MQAPSHHALIAVLTAGYPPFASNLKTRALIPQKARVFGAVGFVLIARRQNLAHWAQPTLATFKFARVSMAAQFMNGSPRLAIVRPTTYAAYLAL